jgi:hypothetical protein
MNEPNYFLMKTLPMTTSYQSTIQPEPVGHILVKDRIFDMSARLFNEHHLIFMRINGYHPSILKIEISEDIFQKMAKFIQETYTIPSENIFSGYEHEHNGNKIIPDGHLIFIRRDLFLSIDTSKIEIYYTNGLFDEFLNKVRNFVDQAFKELKTETDQFQLVIVRGNEYRLKRFRPKPYEINLEDNYNDDFLPVHQRIMDGIEGEDQKGLILLHGEPGTGKTTYIRHLTRLIKKKIIFIPPQFSVSLDTNQFLRMMSRYPDSVVIIEDADNIIADRKSGNNISIPGLLNIADGLLSYYLKTRIICTFNCNLSSIDPALLRKGRLIAMYEFKKLKHGKAQKLARKLDLPVEITQDTTLAELYGYDDLTGHYVSSGRIGFLK